MQTASLSRINLNLLATFCVVAEEGSVTAAARVLARTQPSISVRLRKLEDDLGVRLFQRAGRRVSLTPVGREVAREAAAVLRGAHAIVDRARAGQQVPAGTLRVGALPTLGAHLLAPALADLGRSFPALSLEVRTDLVAPLCEELRHGTLDIVFSVGPIAATGLALRRVGAVAPVVVLPATSRAPRRALGVSCLGNHDLIAFHRGGSGDPFFDAVWRFLERHELDERVRFVVPHIQTIKELVRAGAGAAILPDYTAEASGVSARPLRGLALKFPVTAAARPTSAELPAVRELLARLARAVPARTR